MFNGMLQGLAQALRDISGSRFEGVNFLDKEFIEEFRSKR